MEESKLFPTLLALISYILGAFFLTSNKELLLSPGDTTIPILTSTLPPLFIIISIILFMITLKKR